MTAGVSARNTSSRRASIAVAIPPRARPSSMVDRGYPQRNSIQYTTLGPPPRPRRQPGNLQSAGQRPHHLLVLAKFLLSPLPPPSAPSAELDLFPLEVVPSWKRSISKCFPMRIAQRRRVLSTVTVQSYPRIADAHRTLHPRSSLLYPSTSVLPLQPRSLIE